MTSSDFKTGDVVLVDFRFSNDSGFKKRPSVIVSTDNYNNSRRDVIVLVISSNTNRALFGDTFISLWREAGLLFPSLTTGVLRTVQKNLILHKLGVLSDKDFAAVQASLEKILSVGMKN